VPPPETLSRSLTLFMNRPHIQIANSFSIARPLLFTFSVETFTTMRCSLQLLFPPGPVRLLPPSRTAPEFRSEAASPFVLLTQSMGLSIS